MDEFLSDDLSDLGVDDLLAAVEVPVEADDENLSDEA